MYIYSHMILLMYVMWHNETCHVICLRHTDVMWCCDVYIMSCDILMLIILLLAMYSRLNGWIISFWITDSISRRNTFQCKMCIIISIHQPIYVSNYLSIHPSVHPSIYSSIQPTIHLCMSIHVHPSTRGIYLSIYLSIYSSNIASIYQSIHRSISLSS